MESLLKGCRVGVLPEGKIAPTSPTVLCNFHSRSFHSNGLKRVPFPAKKLVSGGFEPRLLVPNQIWRLFGCDCCPGTFSQRSYFSYYSKFILIFVSIRIALTVLREILPSGALAHPDFDTRCSLMIIASDIAFAVIVYQHAKNPRAQQITACHLYWFVGR